MCSFILCFSRVSSLGINSNYFTQNFSVHNCNMKEGTICTYRVLKQAQVKIVRFKAIQLWNHLSDELKQIPPHEYLL